MHQPASLFIHIYTGSLGWRDMAAIGPEGSSSMLHGQRAMASVSEQRKQILPHRATTLKLMVVVDFELQELGLLPA